MQCPQFGTLNAIPKFYRIEMGDAELFRCNEGYEFASGESELVKICQADGQWLPLGDCWSKYIIGEPVPSISAAGPFEVTLF